MRHLIIYSLLSPILLTSSFAVSSQRGVWFWGSGGDPWGSTNVVGDAEKETAARNIFTANGIANVYGSYSNRPVSEASTIAAWNTSLDTLGITSDLLMSENSWLEPINHSSMTDKIQDRLLTFNAGVSESARFRGLHLDIEPQALATWSGMDGLEKKAELYKLLDLYNVARTYLDDNGGSAITLAADLPVWFDSSPSIAWTDISERDAWFDSVATVLDSISLMPFDRDTFSSIDSGVNWERENIFDAAVRVGLETDILGTWPTTAAFFAMADTIESTYGESTGIDIQAFTTFAPIAPTAIPEPGTVLYFLGGAIFALRKTYHRRK
ncbi:MAG: hypothetical protein ACK5LK_02785 [Chthoniobacterales bacterium]